jgi:hypothetical protein
MGWHLRLYNTIYFYTNVSKGPIDQARSHFSKHLEENMMSFIPVKIHIQHGLSKQ